MKRGKNQIVSIEKEMTRKLQTILASTQLLVHKISLRFVKVISSINKGAWLVYSQLTPSVSLYKSHHRSKRPSFYRKISKLAAVVFCARDAYSRRRPSVESYSRSMANWTPRTWTYWRTEGTWSSSYLCSVKSNHLCSLGQGASCLRPQLTCPFCLRRHRKCKPQARYVYL